jgi:hypothetical protein
MDHEAAWKCRAGQNSVIIRTDGRVEPCFAMYAATDDWARSTDTNSTVDRRRAGSIASTLNHNIGYCYSDARVLKWHWKQARNGFKGARSFED